MSNGKRPRGADPPARQGDASCGPAGRGKPEKRFRQDNRRAWRPDRRILARAQKKTDPIRCTTSPMASADRIGKTRFRLYGKQMSCQTPAGQDRHGTTLSFTWRCADQVGGRSGETAVGNAARIGVGCLDRRRWGKVGRISKPSLLGRLNFPRSRSEDEWGAFDRFLRDAYHV